LIFLEESILGALILICGALFGVGSLLASKGDLGTARVLMMIGGILALPVGVVMIIAGAKFGSAASWEDLIFQSVFAPKEKS